MRNLHYPVDGVFSSDVLNVCSIKQKKKSMFPVIVF